MAAVIGQNIDDIIDYSHKDRFFYGLRRTDEGELWLGKVDQLVPGDSVTINIPGNPTQNYEGFDEGQEFFDGRDVNHDQVYANLKYEQFKWDSINLFYYINSDGELVVRINHELDDYNYVYPNVTEVPVLEGGPTITFDKNSLTYDNNDVTWDKI